MCVDLEHWLETYFDGISSIQQGPQTVVSKVLQHAVFGNCRIESCVVLASVGDAKPQEGHALRFLDLCCCNLRHLVGK